MLTAQRLDLQGLLFEACRESVDLLSKVLLLPREHRTVFVAYRTDCRRRMKNRAGII